METVNIHVITMQEDTGVVVMTVINLKKIFMVVKVKYFTFNITTIIIFIKITSSISVSLLYCLQLLSFFIIYLSFIL